MPIGRPDASDYTYAAFKGYKEIDGFLDHNVAFSVFALENAKTATSGAYCNKGDCPENKVVQTPWYIGYHPKDTAEGYSDPTYKESESTAIWTQFSKDLKVFLNPQSE